MANEEYSERLPTSKELCYVLAKDIVAYRLDRGVGASNATAATLRRLADEIERQHPALLNSMCGKLNLTDSTVYQSFQEIANEVFASGINWGRIAALYAFCGKLAVYCVQSNMHDLVQNVESWTGEYVADLSEWIDCHGGWPAFNQQFARTGLNGVVTNWWKTGVVLTTVGLGTIAAAFAYGK